MKTIHVFTSAVVAFFLLSSVAVASPMQAQSTLQATAIGTVTATESPNVVITFPLIVSELHGIVQVKGTANLPGMGGYFLEWRRLNDDATLPTDSTSWAPATLPISKVVQGGALGNWDTTQVPDGLYELRLTVTENTASPTYYVVTPLRIDNAQFVTPTPGSTSPRITWTPTSVQASLLINGIALNPAGPTCGSTFTVTVNVNNPTNATTAAGAVYVQDVDLGSGMVTATGSGTIPSLNPGANYVVAVPLNVTLYYGQPHEVRVNIASSQITADYRLVQGNCNVSSATPSATAISSTQIPGTTSTVPSATATADSTQNPIPTSAASSATLLMTITGISKTEILLATPSTIATK